MTTTLNPIRHESAQRHSWRPFAEFLALSFTITWGLAAAAIAVPGFADATMTYLFPVAVAAPSIAAFVIIWRHRGPAGLIAWLRAWTRWRVSWVWWLVPFVGVPALGIAARALEDVSGGRAFDLGPWVGLSILAAIPAAIAFDPGWTEEPGWRGFALPVLLDRFGWRASTGILASITTIWHIPAWFVAGMTQQGFVFVAFVLFHVAVAVIMTCLVIRTGSVLLGGLAMHLMTNLVNAPVIGADLGWAGLLLGTVAVILLLTYRPRLERAG